MFDKNDKAMIVGLNHILNEATFPLKRREIASFVKVMTWLSELDARINKDLEQKPEAKKKKGISK